MRIIFYSVQLKNKINFNQKRILYFTVVTGNIFE